MVIVLVIIIIVFGVVIAGWWSAISNAVASGNYLQVALITAFNVTGLFAVLAASYLWLRSRNLKFYLWIQRQRHKLFPSKSATWDIQARWQGSGNGAVLDSFEVWLKRHYSGRLSVWKQQDRLRSYQVDGRFNVETSYEAASVVGGESIATFVLRIYALTVNFAESKEVLNTDVMPLLDNISKYIRPLPEEQDYNLTMTFTDNVNPFLGLYVQGLHPHEIRHFQVTVTPRSYDKDAKSIIRVSSEQLSITAHSPREFQTMAQDFLSFAPRLAKTTT